MDCDSDAIKFTVWQHGSPPAFCHFNRSVRLGLVVVLALLKARVGTDTEDHPSGGWEYVPFSLGTDRTRKAACWRDTMTAFSIVLHGTAECNTAAAARGWHPPSNPPCQQCCRCW